MARATHRWRGRLIGFVIASAALGLSVVGCATNAADGGRLGTVEVPVELSAQARADLAAEIVTEVKAELDTVAAGIAAVDQSDRGSTVEASGRSRVKVDQSTGDAWTTRALAAGLVVNLAIAIWWSYPLARRRRIRQRKERTAKPRAAAGGTGQGPPKPPPASMPSPRPAPPRPI